MSKAMSLIGSYYIRPKHIRKSLATYPFLKNRYWLPEEEGEFDYEYEEYEVSDVTNQTEIDIATIPSLSIEAQLREKLTQELQADVVKILKLTAYGSPFQEDLSGYGFDSVTFTQFANQLKERYRIPIHSALFFEYTTITEFAHYLAQDTFICFTGNISDSNSNNACSRCHRSTYDATG